MEIFFDNCFQMKFKNIMNVIRILFGVNVVLGYLIELVTVVSLNSTCVAAEWCCFWWNNGIIF